VVTERALPALGLPAARAPWQTPRGGERTLWIVIGLAILAALAASARGISLAMVLAVFVLPLVLVAGQRILLAWQTLLGLILAVILFIPIRRYTVGGGLPIELEPYRILIAIVLACWLLALAADPGVRLVPTGFAKPMLLLAVAIVGSLAFNLTRANEASAFVVKQVSFFASYLLVMLFVASVVRPGPQLDRLLKLLVGGGTIVAVSALYEWRTGYNVFNQLGRVLPILHYEDQGAAWVRGSGVRAMASAQHPIALGAALVMLVPIAVYLQKRTGRILWLGAGGLMTLAALATNSRTAAVMLMVLFACFAWLKRAEVVRLLPAILVLMMCTQAVMPGTLSSFRTILQPSYVIQEQSQDKGTGTGRLADLGPGLAEWSRKPAFGEGFGTRITDLDAGSFGSQQILDNQWLGSLLDMGLAGVVALGWLYFGAARRLGRAARRARGPDSWLLTGLCASLIAFAVGMFTFDAFAFVQVTFFSFVFLGFGVVALRGQPDGDPAPRRAGAPRGTRRGVVAEARR
jgi:polysaccharide biosynthesis protein PslJ